jgi:hypothetical protein
MRSDIVVMETLGGFPNLPAMVRAERSSAASHAEQPISSEKTAKNLARSPLRAIQVI